MNPKLTLRLGVLMVLLAWAFLDYCFVRSAFGTVLPGIDSLLVILALALLLMIPVVFVVPLWVLPEARLHMLASRRKAGEQCPRCGHSMQGSPREVCPECGPITGDHVPRMRTMVLACVGIWLSAWLIGAAAGESLARVDESAFIRDHAVNDESPEIVRRRWPLWGSLEWDERTGTARSTMN